MTSQPHACALLTLVPHDGDGWPDVVVPILRWLKGQAPALLPRHRMALLASTHDLDLTVGDEALAVAHLADDGGRYLEWALRYSAPDPAFAERRWRTDIGLLRDGPCWRVSLLLSYGLAPGHIGRDPPAPPLGPPSVLEPLLTSGNWRVAPVGDFALVAQPHLLPAAKGNRLVAAIEDGGRALPIVYLSLSPDGTPLCSPQALAAALAGAAVTVVAASAKLDRELDWLLPQGFGCSGGAVRVYLPGARLDDEDDAQRHSLLSPDTLAQMSPEDVVQTIARGVLSWNLTAPQVPRLTVDDVQLHALERGLSALRASVERDGNNLREYVALLEQENRKLIAEARALVTEARQRAADYADLQARSDDEVARLSRELARARQWPGARAGGPEEEPDLDALRELPEALPAMLDAICRLYPTRLRATERARRSAEGAAINGSREVRGAWRVLYALATTMYDLVFAEGAAGDLPRRFGNLTGIKCALTEGRQTKSDERMMALRRDIDDQGNPIDITPHLKLGHHPSSMLRVHFAIDHARRLLIIGHCGDHLDTFGTQWVR